MATITLTPSGNAAVSHTFGEASFSSYVNGSDERSIAKLSELGLGGKKTGYGEIGVFGAEKYFNGVMDEEDTNKNCLKNNGRVEMQEIKARSKRGAPSSCSEASWNSRSALLPTLQSRQEKGNSKNIFTALGCKCYCSDYKSVDVDENTADNKSPISFKRNADFGDLNGKVTAKLPIEIKHGLIGTVKIKPMTPTWFKEEKFSEKIEKVSSGRLSEDCFTLPITKSDLVNLPIEEEKERKSLEVFGSPVMGKEQIALSLEKRLSMLTWDANPKSENSPIVRIVPEDDAASDTSSDLFEIKSFSNNGHPFFRRQASDSMSGCMSPITCYEPSEASIDWSVVTASAANFSGASDHDEPNPTANNKKQGTPKTTGGKTVSKNMEKRSPSNFLSCRSHDAVKVIGGAHKLPAKKPVFKAPTSRLQAESKVTDLETAHAQCAFAMRPISQLHPARAADSLYMH